MTLVSGDSSGPASPRALVSSRRSIQSVRRIRKGVVAIDRTTTALNNDAASGRISCAEAACAKRTKPNSPAWLINKPSRMLRGQPLPNARAKAAMISVLMIITASATLSTSQGSDATADRSSIIPTDRKKRPSRMDRNGSTSLSSSCR